MRTTNYPSDLTDEQFAVLEPLLPRAKPGGRPRTVNLHDIIDAILYVNRTGGQWRALPSDYPPWSTAYDYFRKWRKDGTWQAINDALRDRVRKKAGRKRSPRTAYLDSQSVKASGVGGETGYDGGKKVKGRKRHLVVDSLGLLLAVMVTGAGVSDPRGALDLVGLLPLHRLPRLRVIWADAAYAVGYLVREVAEWGQYALGIVRRPEGVKGWVLLPKRWVIERTFGWLLRFRRHARDYERETESSEAMICVSMITMMLHRLAPEKNKYPFRYAHAA
jgi:putative transposase